MKHLTKKEVPLFVKENIGLIHLTIRKYFRWTGVLDGSGNSDLLIEYDDLLSDGSIGLIEAAKRFDKSRNIKFGTYAVYYIRDYIQRGVFRFSKQTLRYPKQIHFLKIKVDKICKEKNLDYKGLYGAGLLSLKDYNRLILFVMLNRTSDIDSCEDTNDSFKHENDSINYLKKLIWKVVCERFKHDRKRNFYLICLKLNLENKREMKYKEIQYKLKKRYKQNVNIQTLPGIVFEFTLFFRKKILDLGIYNNR